MNENQNQISDGLAVPGGIVTVEVIRDGKNGPEVIQRSEGHNLIVTIGKRMIWRKVTGLSTKLFKYFQIGTSGAAAASNQSGVLNTGATGTLKLVNLFTMCAGRTFQWMYSYASGAGSKSITGIKEVALMDQATSPGGSLLMRCVLSPAVNKTTADKLKITYKARIT